MNSVSRFFAIAAFVFASIVVPVPAHGEPADPDSSFGTDGIARLPGLWVQSVAPYPDGRLALLLGHRTAPYTQLVVRIDASGRIDSSFAPLTPPPNFVIDSIAVTRFGRLVTLQSLLTPPTGETRLTRHLDDGSPDSTFGESGVALVSRFARGIARSGESGEFSTGLVVGADDRLYMSTEQRRVAGPSTTWITRVGATGQPVEHLNRSDPYLTGFYYGPLLVGTDGSIVAVLPGYQQFSLGGLPAAAPALVRLVDGIPDRTFGVGGIAFHPVRGWATTNRSSLPALQTTSDGGFAVVGSAYNPQGDSSRVIVVKFTAGGVVDTTFGESGVAFPKLTRPGDFVQRAKLAIQPDGRLVVAGTIQEVSDAQFSVLRTGVGRLTVDGRPDPQFAPAGVASFWADGWTTATSVSVRSDGRIVVVGEVENTPGLLGSGEAVVVQFQGGDSTRIRPLAERRAIEYFHAGFGHYFLTADAHEIMTLDHFNPGGWSRTGQTFRVWDDDDPSLRPACRFWSDQSFTPKSSHFYTPYEAECATVRNGSTWRFERNAFSLRTPQGPAGAGSCDGYSQPLFRAYNNGLGGAPNHRYTTQPAVLDEMLAKGWTMEGEAQTGVFACVPAD